MFTKRMVLFSPDDTSAGSSGDSKPDPAIEQRLQQAAVIQSQYDQLQVQIKEGKLVDPDVFLKKKIDAGDIYTKERFTGLQQTFQGVQDVLKGLEPELAQIKEKSSKLEETLTAKEAEEKKKDAELEELKRSKQRSQTIFKKFPLLAPFEAEGLLPEVTADKLEEVLGAFQLKLEAVQKDASSRFIDGGSSSTPQRKDDKKDQSAKAHLTTANEALRTGDMKTYNAEYDLYLAATMDPTTSKT